ncbi:MAG TPA: hypothetical protein DEB17_03810 [Chlorobaculum sp.]|uniref:Uncharacterized protein n=1 Tax=Chlorobaculum tepidum (strain ATCC 49652 / DSM 12025 / NBRC 103806 / TLS) TaxID=194439 RepID=Q8KDW8_CHLTE|nr:hypothetical protein CT0926 [Chlorobaculum tepidum TLS]HBU23111.1 hypothetical protein [Chlorobaculum sp.]
MVKVNCTTLVPYFFMLKVWEDWIDTLPIRDHELGSCLPMNRARRMRTFLPR